MFSKPIKAPMKIWIEDFDLKTKEAILNQAKLEGYIIPNHVAENLANVGGLSFDVDKRSHWWGNTKHAEEHYEHTTEYGEEIFWHPKPTRTIDLNKVL